MIKQIELPSTIDAITVPQQIRDWIAEANSRIEAFQDCWLKTKIEQFVAADYELVYQSLTWLMANQQTIGNRFLEWGCGFAVVSALASSLGLDVIGIEAEGELIEQGNRTVASWNVPIELVQGNFLPPGSEDLSADPTLPSLGHDVDCVYEKIDSELSDFAIVYSYPWPGEDEFHADVFDAYAQRGAFLMMFCGPYDIRLFQKT